jgi:hypothetical protein
MFRTHRCLLVLLLVLCACDAQTPERAAGPAEFSTTTKPRAEHAASIETAPARHLQLKALPGTVGASSALSQGQEAPDPQADTAPRRAVPTDPARAGVRGTRVTVDPRFAHVIVAHEDERGNVVTRCVTQLEHPLDALFVPPRHSEVQ